MIKRGIVKMFIDLLRWSVRTIFLVTTIFISLFICWFCYWFLAFLKQWCENSIFSEPWGW
ncbi:MAG: hypothetical protein CEE38_06110 [Planctomycetes bacterium B3_Pla]|nr:MAG: hypothetical protein CEE38_06110 [Planctomycetes bacterium B3_Pla]